MTDRSDGEGDDEGLSSDDLLKDAKEGFGLEDGSSGVAASQLESSFDESIPDDLAEPTPTIEEIAAELASAESPTEAGTSVSSADLLSGAGAPAQRADVPLPGDQIGTVPPPPPPSPSRAEPAPEPAAPRQDSFFAKLRRNWWIVAVVVIGISVVANVFDTSEPIADQVPGDCFDNPSGDEVTDIKVIDCSEAHDLEVFAVITLGGVGFPGDFALGEQAFESCLEEFEGYVGEPYATSSLYLFPFTPTEESWDAGDRGGLCVVYEPVPGTDGEEIGSRFGSVRNSGL